MRKIVLALAAVAAVGIAIPTFTTAPAEAREVVIIKKHRDHGRHLGWHKHRYFHRGHVIVR
jgi:hypothetical protein